jgi:hypothetical protein
MSAKSATQKGNPSMFATGVTGFVQLARTADKFNHTVSEISQVVANLQTELKSVEAERRADAEAIAHIDADLRRLAGERALIEARMRKNQTVAAEYDVAIGPIDEIYSANVAAIGQLYEAAKGKHAKGIQVLVEQFDYHPAYKRGIPGEISGIPFKPK